MASLGRLGRSMAALPDVPDEDVVMADAKEDKMESGTHTPVLEAKGQSAGQQQGSAGGGGGKKKKKGKR